MKISFKKILIFMLTTVLLISSIVFTATPDSTLAATKKKSTPKISISKTSVLLLKGQTTTLKLKNAKGKVVWKSSKSSVVKVTNGKLKALKAGKATITAKANGKTKKCNVIVEDPKLSDDTLDLEVDEEIEVELTGCSHKVTWKSSNPDVATVKNGEITAIEAGTTVISATVHGKTYKCNVTVYDSEEDEDFDEDPDDEDDAEDSTDSDDIDTDSET